MFEYFYLNSKYDKSALVSTSNSVPESKIWLRMITNKQKFGRNGIFFFWITSLSKIFFWIFSIIFILIVIFWDFNFEFEIFIDKYFTEKRICINYVVYFKLKFCSNFPKRDIRSSILTLQQTLTSKFWWKMILVSEHFSKVYNLMSIQNWL